MRNKTSVGVVVACLVGVLCLSSCDPNQDQIVKIVAKTAGTVAAQGWILINNPDPVVLSQVTNILGIVKEKAVEVSEGETYVDAMYPELATIIDNQVDEQYQYLCKMGVLVMLTQLDALFIQYPEWKKTESTVIAVVVSFVDGANQVFGMTEDNPIRSILVLTNKKKNAMLLAD